VGLPFACAWEGGGGVQRAVSGRSLAQEETGRAQRSVPAMALTERENYLRTAALEGGEWIPCNIGFSPATWVSLREELEEVLVRHPILFPGFRPGERDFDHWEYGPAYRYGERFTDAWGCVWDNAWGGVEGQVVEHPLAVWEALESYQIPDPMVTADRGPANWCADRTRVAREREEGRLTRGSVPHGFLLMRLWYLRGFEQLMADLMEGPPQLSHLIGLLVAHNRRIVGEWLSIRVDVMHFGEDLGTQQASITGPALFRRWLAPAYRELMSACQQAGAYVYLHSDGCIMDLVDDLIDCGVSILNPQDLANGIDNLAKHVKGRACLCLDIDRQRVIPFGRRQEVRELIREEVIKLGSPRGGLMFGADIYPPTPPENIDALCCALEEFRTYWWDGRG
jgi:uroporphyrinogen decarboxylase